MARIPGASPDQAPDRVRAVLDDQARTWGQPLANHLLYARRPSIFRGMRSMWTGLADSGLLSVPLVALLNRRVAALIGCAF